MTRIKIEVLKKGSQNLLIVKGMAGQIKIERYREILQAGQNIARFVRTGIEREYKAGAIYKTTGSGLQKRLAGRVNRDPRTLIRTAKNGRVAQRKGQRGLYQASAPGQFAGIVSGRMLRTLDWKAESSSFFLRVGFEVLYARFLELGTARLAKRPSLERARIRTEGETFNYVKWANLLKRSRPKK